jgi:hypothetical protein
LYYRLLIALVFSSNLFAETFDFSCDLKVTIDDNWKKPLSANAENWQYDEANGFSNQAVHYSLKDCEKSEDEMVCNKVIEEKQAQKKILRYHKTYLHRYTLRMKDYQEYEVPSEKLFSSLMREGECELK